MHALSAFGIPKKLKTEGYYFNIQNKCDTSRRDQHEPTRYNNLEDCYLRNTVMSSLLK